MESLSVGPLVLRRRGQELFHAFVDASAMPTHRGWDEGEVVAAIRGGLALGQSRHGDLGVDPCRFARALARAVSGPDDLATVDVGDLYLAHACSDGRPGAVAGFVDRFRADIDRAADRLRHRGVAIADFRQVVLDRLFVATDDRAPRITQYAGRGPLRAWVRVTATRMVVDWTRARGFGREAPVDPEVLVRVVPTAAADPELCYVQRTYRPQLQAALGAAFAELDAKQRNLLRRQILDGFTHDQLGALYGVHRTTAARWLEQARNTLLAAARRDLQSRLGVAAADFASIVRELRSQIDVSVHRILGAPSGVGGEGQS